MNDDSTLVYIAKVTRIGAKSDNAPIGFGTLTRDLGGITIWTLWSNGLVWVHKLSFDSQQQQFFCPLLLDIHFLLRSCKYFTKLPSSLTS